MQKSILIISSVGDVHADVVEKNLLERGENVFRFNSDSYENGEVTIQLTNTGTSDLAKAGQNVSLSSIKSVWLRKPRKLKPAGVGPKELAFATEELQELLEHLNHTIPDALWVSNILSIIKTNRKFRQLQEAQAVGFRVPKTCITNSSAKAMAFIKAQSGSVIYKTLRAPTIQERYGEPSPLGSRNISVPTSILTDERLKSIDFLPRTGGIFQEYIEKDYEIRVTVIGNKVFAAKIDSQQSDNEKWRVDWRVGVLNDAIPISALTLPEVVERKCLQLLANFGLKFGAIDLIYSTTGDYVFLEVNPVGQWLWLVEPTGHPMVETMADLLHRGGLDKGP